MAQVIKKTFSHKVASVKRKPVQATTRFGSQQLARHICPWLGCVCVCVCARARPHRTRRPVQSFVARPGKAGVARKWRAVTSRRAVYFSVCVYMCLYEHTHTHTDAYRHVFVFCFFIAAMLHSSVRLNDKRCACNDSLNQYGCAFRSTCSTVISCYLSCL